MMINNDDSRVSRIRRIFSLSFSRWLTEDNFSVSSARALIRQIKTIPAAQQNKTHVLSSRSRTNTTRFPESPRQPVATMTLAASDDYYDILGVATDASTDDIRAAYQRLALAHHPDKQLQQAASVVTDTRAFIRITEAWNTLRDAELRRVYDAEVFRGRIDDVPMVHQVLQADEVQRTADGCGLAYTCRCGAVCRVDTHNRLDGDAWRFNTCDECSHAVEMEVEL